jgi:hypothetical protein
MNKNLSIKFSLVRGFLLALLLNLSLGLSAQQLQYLGDNMGSHIATKDLKMNAKNIVNAAGLVIGSASFTNPNVILDINSLSKVMVIPRITNIATLTGTIDNGSLAYDVATNKFYIRENNAWSSFGDFSLASGQVMLGNASNRAIAVALSGDITVSPLGVTTIGDKKVSIAKLATTGTADANKVFATNITSGDPELISRNDLAIPKYTLAQRDAIVSPANNMLIFNTDSRTLQVYDSGLSAWVNTGSAASNNLPVVSTAISSATSTKPDTAVVQGTVTNPGTIPVTARGVCWNIATGPTTSNFVTNDGAGSGTFSSILSGLRPSTKYYVRAYAVNGLATIYGNEITVTTNTAGTPVVSSTAPGTNLTYSSATSGGTITSDRGSAVTARGIVWNDTGSPLVTNSSDLKAVDTGIGIGSFQSEMTGLSAAKKYFVRAYATNGTATSYGPQVEIITAPVVLPTVTTADATKTGATVSVGGTVTDGGGGTVTSRGVYYSTSQPPTSANSTRIIGNGLGAFSASLSALTPGTTYYYTAFATNSTGTTTGLVKSVVPNGPPVLDPAALTYNSLTTNSINLASSLNNDGGQTTTRGFVYSTTAGPTTANSSIAAGTGVGNFSSLISGLTQGTPYYFRAYATNPSGTVYGTEFKITTKATLVFNFNGSAGSPYTSTPIAFTVPDGVTSINIKCYGASGGGTYAGQGGYAEGQLAVAANQTYYLFVGGVGATNTGSTTYTYPASYNGGGQGYGINGAGGGGGGATDVRAGGQALSNRIIVAGGGGGAGDDASYNAGGAGGGDSGADALGVTQDYAGKGGTQTSGGARQSVYVNEGTSGTLGQGGNAGTPNQRNGGGGGGYYGGGSGSAGGGGGGSGMINKNSSYQFSNPILTRGGNVGFGKIIISW